MPQLPALTGLRFVAALWVVLYHLGLDGGRAIGSIVQFGYVGVSLFCQQINPDHLRSAVLWWPNVFWQPLVRTNPIACLPEFLMSMALGALFLRDRVALRSAAQQHFTTVLA